MKIPLRTYVDNLPAIISILYCIGYCYQKSYYYQFDIDIEYYVSLSDLLFYTVDFITIVFTFSIILEGIIATIIIASFFNRVRTAYKNKKSKKNIFKTTEYVLSKKYNTYSLILVVALLITSTYTFSNYKYLFSSLLTLFIFKLFISYKKNIHLDARTRLINSTFIISLSSLFAINIFLGSKQASKLKQNYDSIDIKQVEIKDEQNFYSSEQDVNYIGETTNYIFLYEIYTKKSIVINKGNVKSFKIINGK